MADAKLARRVSMSSPTGSICSSEGGTAGGGGDSSGGIGDGDTNGGGDGEGDLGLLGDDNGKSGGDGEDDDGMSDGGEDDDGNFDASSGYQVDNGLVVNIEQLVKFNSKARILELKRRNLKDC
ncbi:hypothetical protein Tco_0886389 [Tanacetum coccineum]